MRVHLIGGFLGAGKTTLIRALARHLTAEGEQVAVVTNDQGHVLVDTHLCAKEITDVTEITGGCICCRFDDLEAALVAIEAEGATVAVVEAVGSCTDLIATVLSPLTQTLIQGSIEANSSFDLAPLAVVVDPWRIQQVESGGVHNDIVDDNGVHNDRNGAAQNDNVDSHNGAHGSAAQNNNGVHNDIAYLIRKQIQEADVILMSRSDLDPPDVRGALERLAPGAALVDVSGRTDDGIAAWLDARPKRPAAPLEIDYARYASAEALLGWSNGVVHMSRMHEFSPAQVMRDFLSDFSSTDVAHVKLVSIDPVGGSGSLVRRGSDPVLDTASLPSWVTQARILINARVAMPAAQLEMRVRGAMNRALPNAALRWEHWECFEPSPPKPIHRHSFRCDSGNDASCCAAFYDRPEVRYLLGDSLHPGGIDLTLKMAQHLGLGDGQSVLDVACGQATSLKAVRQVWPVETTGLDVGIVRQGSGRNEPGRNGPERNESERNEPKSNEPERNEPKSNEPQHNDSSGIDFHQGDAHDIPFEDGRFDAILCECALSTFVDQPLALREMRRVLKKGGRLALSDMVVESEVPESLKEWVNVGTCLAGALRFEGYKSAIEEAGFRIVKQWDASDGLLEMIARIKRNLLGLALAKASGNLPDDVDIDVKEGRRLLRDAQQAIRDGLIGYAVFIAERVN